MDLAGSIHKFTEQPYPLWENELTEMLVQHKWKELSNYGLHSAFDYSTDRALLNSSIPPINNIKPVTGSEKDVIYLEAPSFNILQSFYDEHGLEPLSENELESNNVVTKIRSALAILQLVKPVYSCVSKLVRSIQVLQQHDDEIDVSYSHPKIPFSIFITVCKDDSTLSSLRVAESILHEAMHLKLSLIENVVPLVEPNSDSLYFSPWRDEERPVQGVLHGLFVFKAIYDFYYLIINDETDGNVSNFIMCRLQNIKFEIESLNNLLYESSLLINAKSFVKQLLQIRIY